MAGWPKNARWRLHGVELASGAFIDIAEECGCIVPIGRLVRRRAIQTLCRCEAAGLAPGALALNVTVVELKQPDFAAELMALLAELRVPPERIEIVITENVLLDRESDKAAAALQALHALGMTITLDDNGTGYAFLVKRIGVDPDDAVIVRSIINLARTLGLTVVAEAVETADQLAFLRLAGCDFAQGYVFAEPPAPRALEAFLGRQRSTGSRIEVSLPPSWRPPWAIPVVARRSDGQR